MKMFRFQKLYWLKTFWPFFRLIFQCSKLSFAGYQWCLPAANYYRWASDWLRLRRSKPSTRRTRQTSPNGGRTNRHRPFSTNWKILSRLSTGALKNGRKTSSAKCTTKNRSWFRWKSTTSTSGVDVGGVTLSHFATRLASTATTRGSSSAAPSPTSRPRTATSGSATARERSIGRFATELTEVRRFRKPVWTPSSTCGSRPTRRLRIRENTNREIMKMKKMNRKRNPVKKVLNLLKSKLF